MKNCLILLLLLLLLLLFVVSCTTKTTSNSLEVKEDSVFFNADVTYPLTVSLLDAIRNVDTTVALSSFVESIEYIPMKLPIDSYLRFFFLFNYDEDDELFFVGDLNKVLAVNKEGKLMNTIGRSGQGPGEFILASAVSVDTKNKKVYIYSTTIGSLLRYGYKGVFEKKMFKTQLDQYRVSKIFYNNNNFVAISDMYHSALEPVKDKLFGFGVLDTLGNMIDCTPSQLLQIDTKKDAYIQLMFNSQMTQFKEHKLLVNSGLSDTIFTVENDKVVPRYLLDYGDEKPDLSKIWSRGSERMSAIHNSIFIMNPAYETSRCFIIKLKKRGLEYIIINDKYLQKSYSIICNCKDYLSPNEEVEEDPLPLKNWGFYNDVDGGVDSYPVAMSSDGNYWVSYVEANQMKELLTDEYFAKRATPQNKEQQEKLKKLVQSLKEDDDQVLILMKLKKDVL